MLSNMKLCFDTGIDASPSSRFIHTLAEHSHIKFGAHRNHYCALRGSDQVCCTRHNESRVTAVPRNLISCTWFWMSWIP